VRGVPVDLDDTLFPQALWLAEAVELLVPLRAGTPSALSRL